MVRTVGRGVDDGRGSATLEIVLHRSPLGRLSSALREIATFPEVLRPPFLLPVISERAL